MNDNIVLVGLLIFLFYLLFGQNFTESFTDCSCTTKSNKDGCLNCPNCGWGSLDSGGKCVEVIISGDQKGCPTDHTCYRTWDSKSKEPGTKCVYYLSDADDVDTIQNRCPSDIWDYARQVPNIGPYNK